MVNGAVEASDELVLFDTGGKLLCGVGWLGQSFLSRFVDPNQRPYVFKLAWRAPKNVGVRQRPWLGRISQLALRVPRQAIDEIAGER